MKNNCTMSSTSSISSLAKIGLHIKPKPFRVLILGATGVGKTALVVRFITRRFIGEYDPNLEQVYTHSTIMNDEAVLFEILDAAGHLNEDSNVNLVPNIKWADAFILMYSVTDATSFEEVIRLRFLINYNKRRKKMGSTAKDNSNDFPVLLVANKTDQVRDCGISREDGQRRYRDLGCAGFKEISVRESIEQVRSVFHDLWQAWQLIWKCPKLRRTTSEQTTNAEHIVSPESTMHFSIFDQIEKRRSFFLSQSNDESKTTNNSSTDVSNVPFRERASTDGTIFSRSRRWSPRVVLSHKSQNDRRMSISMRGTNGSY